MTGLTRIIGMLLFGLIGLVLFGLGIRLVKVGGSFFHMVAGIAILGVALLIWRRSGWAPWLYFAIVMLTIAYALFEVGLDPWALLPWFNVLVPLSLWFALGIIYLCDPK